MPEPMLPTESRRTLTREVIQSLRQYIVANRLGPGDRLPPERELAASLKVGRSTVREALTVLEVIGAITRQTKRGTVIAEVDFGIIASVARFLVVRSEQDLRELFVARRLVEVNLLPLVRQNWSEETHRRLLKAIEEQAGEIDDGGNGVDADLRFHEELVIAANNAFLRQYAAMIQEFFTVPSVRVPITREQMDMTLREHIAVVQALDRGEVEHAQKILFKHLSHYIDRGIVPPDA